MRLSSLALACLLAAPALAQNQPAGPAPARKLEVPGRGKPANPAQPPSEPGESAKPPANLPDPQQMQAIIKAGIPGEAHQKLEAMVGEWTALVRTRTSDLAPWTESKGSARNRMDMEGRFLVSEFSGDFAGAPFTGLLTWGYDNTARRYQSTWRDSLSTGLTFLTGSADGPGKVFTMTGEFADPATGRARQMKVITTIAGPDAHTTEFFQPDASGAMFKNMEILYTKGGAAPARPGLPTPGPRDLPRSNPQTPPGK